MPAADRSTILCTFGDLVPAARFPSVDLHKITRSAQDHAFLHKITPALEVTDIANVCVPSTGPSDDGRTAPSSPRPAPALLRACVSLPRSDAVSSRSRLSRSRGFSPRHRPPSRRPRRKPPRPRRSPAPRPPNLSSSTGSKRTISFTLSGNTVSKLTIGAGTALCTEYDDAGNPGASVTVTTKKLTFPTLTLNHGTYPSAEGLTINTEFVRPGGSGPFTISKTYLFDEAGYTVDLDIASNPKRTVFGSKIDGSQLAGLAVVFHKNAAGQVNVDNPDRCTFGGNVSLKLKK